METGGSFCHASATTNQAFDAPILCWVCRISDLELDNRWWIDGFSVYSHISLDSSNLGSRRILWATLFFDLRAHVYLGSFRLLADGKSVSMTGWNHGQFWF